MGIPTPLEFVERILPWPGPNGPGWGNLHWYTHKPGDEKVLFWRGKPFKTAQDLIDQAQWVTRQTGDKSADIFFCTTIQSKTKTINHQGRTFEVAEKKAENALATKILFLDVDVKEAPKGYASNAEARKAVLGFCKATGTPLPSALVNSGTGGLHVYWISDRTLTIPEWLPYAEGLKAEATRYGLRCDAGVTADAARVLRVPGTFNRKLPGDPRAVVVTSLGMDYDFSKDLAHLHAVGLPRVTATVKKTPQYDMSGFTGTPSPILAAALLGLDDHLSDGIERNDLPLDPKEVIRNCPHFMDAFKKHGQGHGQGLWHLTVLASTFFEDGFTWAKIFSKGYPSYDEGELTAMWERKLDDKARIGLGWPSCKSFENEGCKSCATCVYRAHDKSPLNLAKRSVPTPDPTNVSVVTNPLTNVVLTEADLLLPDGYFLEGGRICKSINIEKNPKKPPELKSVHIFLGEVISKPFVSNAVPPVLYFDYKVGENYISVAIPHTAYAGDQSLANAFLLAGVVINPNADSFVRSFMRSWVGKIELAVKKLHTAPLGWVIEDGDHTGFSYGGKIFNRNGSETASAIAGIWYTKFIPTGDPGPVLKALEILSQEGNPGLEVLCLQAWASPLVEIAGLKTVAIMWGFSQASAAHKSMAMRTGYALWGAPDQCRDRGGATAIGMENKMDRLRHLPAQIDELQRIDQIDEVSAIFNRLGEGGQGAKATRGGGLRDDKSWQLNLTCGSNTSLYQYLAGKGQATDATVMRGFEILVDKRDNGKYTMTEIDQLMGALEHNYGHLGMRYAKYLAMNRPSINERYKTMDKQVMADLLPPGASTFPNQERFWKTSVTLTLLACELANEIIGKDYFHFDEIKRYLYTQYRNHRIWVARHITIAGTALSTEEIWNKLMGAWMQHQLVTARMGGGTAGRAGSALGEPPIQHPDFARGHTTKIHWLQSPPMIRINYTEMVDTVKLLGYGTEAVDKFEQTYGGKIERKVYLAGIPTTEIKTRCKVWEIPMTPGHPLYDQWNAKANVKPANAANAAAMAQDAANDKGPVASAATA